MSEPFVTICIPAYNAERYLPETLESVRLQSFSDWELIVTEDGSRDGTEGIVRNFARTVSQPVAYQRNDVNQGLSATRNRCIASARGKWIALLDADDLWTSDHLRDLAAMAARGDTDFLHSGSVLFDSSTGQDLEDRVPTPEQLADIPVALYRGVYVVQPSSVLLRRDLFETVGGFNADFRYMEDREYWLRCARAGARFGYTGTVTCRYRRHESSLSRNAARMSLAAAHISEQHMDWDRLPRALRRRQTAEAWTAAGRIVFRDNPRVAAGYFRRALRHAATAPTLWAYWTAARALGLIKRSPA